MTPTPRRPARTAPRNASRSSHSHDVSPSTSIKVVWAALFTVGVFIVVAMVAGIPQAQPVGSGTPSSTEHTTLDLARRDEADITALGSVDAPVVIIEFADYRCPFCGVFDRDTLPRIVSDYVDQGLVRFEWRDLPVLGEQSLAAAVAARAAGEQGMFWEYHTALFAAAPERGHPELPAETLIAFARQVGVQNMDRFAKDLHDAELIERVRADAREATTSGITGTPAFLINNIPLAGAQPLDVFLQIIDSELAKQPTKER